MALLEVKNLKKNFGTTEVLKGISFSLIEGVVLTIIGNSGSGKTTLLRCLNSLERADSGEIIAPIGRVGDSIIKREVSENGLFAHTVYEPIAFSDEYTYVRVILKTGRTHQIRVHFSHIGHPLAGDDLYGNNTKDIARQALHCGEISFIHPTTRKLTVVKAEPPQDMQKLISMIK